MTATALLAFAANSLLCRMALGAGLLDPATFTAVRVGSGAAVLVALAALRGARRGASFDARMVLGLFAYMAGFSFSYLTLDTGTGALILFAVVQLTMFAVALVGGERFSSTGWIGLCLALSGLVWQVAPGVTAPDPLGAALMAVAGLGWAVYTLRGRAAGAPLLTTATNFAWVLPLTLLLYVVMPAEHVVSHRGLWLAATSGALTSGAGYAIWYAVLPALRATTAATVQLAVPALAAVAGVLLLSEPVTLRLVIASVLTLGGILIVLLSRAPPAAAR
ncbi:MAG: DMT family transporter [Pseudomonadota bacterium]